jgi:hypothetical protein
VKPLVLYHAACRDGFCAAWVMSKLLGTDAEYRAVQYGSTPPEVLGRLVFLVDFSYPRPQLEHMATQAAALTILDHHQTAAAALDGFEEAMRARGERVRCVFDMGHSGATIARDFVNERSRAGDGPQAIDYQPPGDLMASENTIADYVADRDLWRWALPDSRDINAWIAALPFEFSAWDDAEILLESKRALAVSFGRVCLQKTRQYVAEVAKNVRFVEFYPYAGVPCVNAPQVDISELLEALLDTFGTIALGWFLRADGQVQVSIRTRGDIDASEMAKRYGGGGHKNAAGFQIGLVRWAQVVLR